MKIDCIADLHGHYPQLEGGDLLIVAGDLTATDMPTERIQFLSWLADQNYKHKIFIAGNHDNSLVGLNYREYGVDYLCDSGTEIEGLKIWGSPWTPWFEGVNPKCTAFMLKEEQFKEQWDLIPDDTDMLITHGPPYGFLDQTIYGDFVGSVHLLSRIWIVRPMLHVFGHIHESYGMDEDDTIKFVNCSHVNERYEPVNKPITVYL